MAEETEEDKAMNRGAQEGVAELIKKFPLFRPHPNVISRYLDGEAISNRRGKLADYADQQNFSKRKKIDYIKKGTKEYILSGNAFSERGKEIFLGKSLEEMAKKGPLSFKGASARKTLYEEGNLQKAIYDAYQLHDLIANEGLQLEDSGVSKFLKYLGDSGFHVPALRLMRSKGEISNHTYRKMIKTVYENIREGTKYLASARENYKKSFMDYFTPQNFAPATTAILGIFGVVLLAYLGLNPTGGVIGSLPWKNHPGMFFIGLASLLSSLAIFLVLRKK